MCQEFASYICNFIMLHVVSDGVLEVDLIDLSQLHEIDSDTVVGQGLSVYITDGTADLEELLVRLDGVLVLSEVVIEDSRAVVGSSFVSGLTCSLASEGKDVVVLQAFLSGYSVVGVSVAHGQTRVVVHDVLLQTLVLFDEALFADDVFLPLWGIEVDRQLDALSLINSQRQIALFL